jgi:hypothetical protein
VEKQQNKKGKQKTWRCSGLYVNLGDVGTDLSDGEQVIEKISSTIYNLFISFF